ncbi:MAG: hypothetical protein MUD12_00060 [Spirochaetes bacterium]|jgi:hypothetical protein|nr:hypothetical protein [Spirochaetota bacterium]
MNYRIKILASIYTVGFLMMPSLMNDREFPVYRVVLDPGHGGRCKSPMSRHGDRYNTLSKTYLDNFKEGASFAGLEENQIVYDISLRVRRILKNCSPDGDYKKFAAVLKKYTDEEPDRVNIVTSLSRKKSISDAEADALEDPNAGYRLFDYPDRRGIMREGRLSKINSLRPNLVVSLHLATDGPSDYIAMNPVIAAPYDFLNEGLKYLRREKKGRAFYSNNRLGDWFCESHRRSDFEWFLNDVSVYFTGCPLEKDRSVSGKFKGYRHNMVSWKYTDNRGWESVARFHQENTRYSRNYMDVVPDGRFWDRERSKYEKYRRDGGEEGFGGDNAYAAYEIIRYMLFSLYKNRRDYGAMKTGKPYISIWIMPVHVNAINAYIEIAYLRRRRDRNILATSKNELAEGIAVGIYSLFSGMNPRKEPFTYLPKGKKIDMRKYDVSDGRSYFDEADD